MAEVNRRQHVRVKTNNLISHESIGKDGRVVSRSMGKALNVSRSGILLETSYRIVAEGISLMAVDLEENLIEMRGRPIYCRETYTGMYQTGISFIGTEEETAKFAVKLIKLFHHRKHNLIMQVAA
jgi:hypothetical protein